MMLDWRLGTMGFGYADWKEVFYPRSTRPGDYLAFYARHFNTVELDTTFHACPDVSRVQKWAASVPEDFRFAVKTPKQITHENRIEHNVNLMRDFLGVTRHFKQKLGVVLIQFPPTFSAGQTNALANFLRQLPTDVRFALEFRHVSWFTAATGDLLTSLGIAWVAGEYLAPPRPICVTSDFLYIRWVGEHERFSQLNHVQTDMTARLLGWQDDLLAKIKQVKTVWGYFNNDYSGYAIATCNQMKQMLNLPTHGIDKPTEPTLFG